MSFCHFIVPQKIGFQVLWFALPLSNQIVIKLYSCTPLLLFDLKVNAMRITRYEDNIYLQLYVMLIFCAVLCMFYGVYLVSDVCLCFMFGNWSLALNKGP